MPDRSRKNWYTLTELSTTKACMEHGATALTRDASYGSESKPANNTLDAPL